jgi:uncharacterized protein (DUF1684 family)
MINVSPEYAAEIDDWHLKRIENLKKPSGWLNLVGLYWLEEGENSFGSGKENNIVFPPKAPIKLGSFIKSDSVIMFVSDPDAEVIMNHQRIFEIKMNNDLVENTTILEYGSLRWFLIKRGDKYGIRLRDLEADLLSEFEGIERFPINPKWKMDAKFIPYQEPKEISIPTILGTIDTEISPGTLEFLVDGNSYSLEPVSAGKRLFVVFADLTSGEETYGAGRFLYVDALDSNNNVILDFNKAYNPPCAFTKYATCPLPPDQNKLKIRVTAGEKKYSARH